MRAEKRHAKNGDAPPKHRPLRTAPSAKQTRHKIVNPNAETAYNHRARFSRFKRRIYAQRRWLVEHHVPHSAESRPDEKKEQERASQSASAAPAESDGPWESQPDATPVLSTTTCTSSPRVTRAVAEMKALFGQLDTAVKQRRFGRAAYLRRSLRARQQHLRRLLLSSVHADSLKETATTTTATAPATNVESTSPIGKQGVSPPSFYHSFHPPSTWLGVGRHPHSDWVDQRSGRYPTLCTAEQLLFVLRHCAANDGEEGVARDGTEGVEEWTLRLPTFPAATPSTTNKNNTVKSSGVSTSTSASSPPHHASQTTTPTRAQRQLKASLFVAAYCTNLLTDTLDDLVFTLLQSLYKEQRDLKQRQPMQFKARQRYVVGFQEVLKCLKAGRVRLVLLAADVEAVEAPEKALQETSEVSAAAAATAVGSLSPRPAKPTRRKAFQSLHEAVAQVQQLCSPEASDSNSATRSARASPLCVTCMSRQRLSYALYAKGSKVGCVGVMQAEKSRDALKAVVACGRLLTEAYAGKMAGAV